MRLKFEWEVFIACPVVFVGGKRSVLNERRVQREGVEIKFTQCTGKESNNNEGERRQAAVQVSRFMQTAPRIQPP
jgi:hypothetical protein